MNQDFRYALLIGWSILLLFWTVILIFVYLRKPPKSILTFKLTLQSLSVFAIGYIVIFIYQ